MSPPIEAIDEPAPEAVWQPLPDKGDAVIKTKWSMCFSDQAKGNDQGACAATPDEVEHLNQMEAEFEHAVRPAKGTTPRAIAQLRLPSHGPKARARLIVWRNGADKLCVETEEQKGANSGDDGPSGPCVPGDRCRELCVEVSGLSGSDLVFHYLASGVVASEADHMRITLDDGRAEDVALTGPVVPGFPKYRVFMVDLGRSAFYRRLELRHGDELVAEEKTPAAVIRAMQCEDGNRPEMPSPNYQSRSADRCVARATHK